MEYRINKMKSSSDDVITNVFVILTNRFLRKSICFLKMSYDYHKR